MRVAGTKRKLIALAGLALLATLAWTTMDADKIRILVMVVLGGFAVRVALTPAGRQGDAGAEEGRQGL